VYCMLIQTLIINVKLSLSCYRGQGGGRVEGGRGEGENLLFPNTILFGHDSWMEKQTEGRVRRSVPTVMPREFIYVHSVGSVL
jgi:hypothetical protein